MGFFKSWLGKLFLTEPEIGTGRRFFIWKRIGVTSVALMVCFLVARASLGNSKVPADEKNYSGLSDDDISRLGVVIFKMGPIEIKKVGGDAKKLFGGSGSTESSDQGQVISRKDRAHSEYVVPAGAKLAVVLDGNLNSQLPQSPVVAYAKDSLVFQGRTLIPTGAKILGRTGDTQDGERISLQFDQVVFPSGYQLSANGVGMMPDGSPGIVGELHSQRTAQVLGALGTSFIAGAASAFETDSPNIFGIQQPQGSTQNAILNGVASASLDQAKRFGTEAQASKGYVTLQSGASFIVYFEKEIDLAEVLQ